MEILRKKIRAFTGLAGSPLATITGQQPQRGRGRPRKYKDNAERMRVNRKAAKHEAQQTPEYWNTVLAKEGLSVSQGRFMKEAEKGKGELVTGGWDSDKISDVVAASERDGKTIDDMDTGGGGSGRCSSNRSTAIGRTDADEVDSVELVQRYHHQKRSDERFGGLDEVEQPDEPPVEKQEKKLSTTKGKIPPKSLWVSKMVCPSHPELQLQAARWDKEIKLFSLGCGCTRGLALE